MNFRSPQTLIFAGIVLTIVSAPLYVVRWSYFDILPTTLLELLVWVVLIMWGAWRIKRRDYTIPYLATDRSFFIFWGISVLGIVFANDTVAALGIARAYFWEPMLFAGIVYDVLIKQETPKVATSALLSVLLLSGVWLAVMGILQAGLGWFIITAHQADRAHAVFNNGNALALYLGPLLAMLLGWQYWDRGKKVAGSQNIAMIGVLLLAGFVLAKSTGGILALLGTVGVLAISELTYRVSKKDWNATLFRGLVVGTMLVSLLFLFVAPRFAPEVDNPWVRPGGTAEVRLCLWEGTGQLIRDNWLFGVGLSGFKEVYSESYVTCDAEPLEYPHNFWMAVWAELGLLGVAGFGLVFWQIGGKLVRGRLTTGLFLAFSYFLLHGLIDVPYFKNDLSVVFWTLAALLLVYADSKKD